jgi:hypothetical protein
MNCPYCGKEMELGYIQSRDGVTWSDKEYMIKSLATLHNGSISLANGVGDKSTAVYAYRCGDCKKVIIDYSKYAD